MNYGSSTDNWEGWRWVRHYMIFTMRDIYTNVNLNSLTKFTSGSRRTEFKDILPWKISQMITKTLPISTRIVISYAIKRGIPFWVWRKVNGTETATSEFPNGGKAIVEQALASEESKKSKHGFCPPPSIPILPSTIIMGKLNLKFAYMCGGINLYGGSYNYMGWVIFITTLWLFPFFRNSQHSEKWSVSFRNFFRKSECIRSCWMHQELVNASWVVICQYTQFISKGLKKNTFCAFWAFTYIFVKYVGLLLIHSMNGLIILYFLLQEHNEKVSEVGIS